jgi:hypothetical protein
MNSSLHEKHLESGERGMAGLGKKSRFYIVNSLVPISNINRD